MVGPPVLCGRWGRDSCGSRATRSTSATWQWHAYHGALQARTSTRHPPAKHLIPLLAGDLLDHA
jgi:hypothetical protein